MNKLIKIFVLFVLAITYSITVSSTKINMGKITIKVGETRYVEAVPKNGYTATGSWTTSGSNFYISSKGDYSCKIYGLAVGSGTLSYSGVVARSGTWTTETWDLYWDITVLGPDPDPNTGNHNTVEEPKEKWSDVGNYSISWYDKNLDEYTISTNKELAGMSFLINNGYTEFEGKTFKLANDIDLSGKKWIQCKTFKGNFNGQGHSITGVYMSTDHTDQRDFGFWRAISNSEITNLTLEGVANYSYNEAVQLGRYPSQAGGLVGIMTNGSKIEHCIVNMDMTFERTYYNYEKIVDVGGICGNSLLSGVVGGTIAYCTFVGNMYYKGGTLNPHIGGIVGTGDSVSFCEFLASTVEINSSAALTYPDKHIFNGIGFCNKVICCRSIIYNINTKCTNTSHHGNAPIVFSIAGISCGPSVNCYSSIAQIKMFDSATLPSEIQYGGIASVSGDKIEFSYSNNDVKITGNYNELERMYDGNTIPSEQMKTSAFLDELNMYPILEMGGPVWKQKEGDYPYINDIWDDEPVSHEDKCATPTISYANGKLTFQSETEGVEFHSSITDTDIKDYITSVIDLTATYNISVYATKEGYENSDTATATLCWIDAEPFAEGTKEAEDNVKEVKAMPVLIQANNGVLNISGAPDGADIFVYDTGGRQLGTTKAINETAKIVISQVPQIVIVKIGEKAVKVHMK